MKHLLCICVLMLAWGQGQVRAQATPSPVTLRLLVDAGIAYGGDEILKVFFTNGGDQSVRAGQGASLGVGGQMEFARVKNLMLRATIGFKYNTTAADNANIRLTRFPLTFVPYWKIQENFRIGAGVTTHLGANLYGDGFFPDVPFTSSLGPHIELGYKMVGVTYTSLNYLTANGTVYSASAFGASLSFTVPGSK